MPKINPTKLEMDAENWIKVLGDEDWRIRSYAKIALVKIGRYAVNPLINAIKNRSLKTYGAIKREEWRSDGSWYGVLEMPAGSYASFLNKLGEVTKGSGEAKTI